MIVKGQSVAGAGRLATHLLRADQNERVEILELRGSAAGDLRGALTDMEALAAGLACKRPLYHASINTPAHEALSAAQRALAVDRLEAALGLTGQPRAVVVHEKLGREHTHVVWARAAVEHGRVVSDSFNYRRHELVARELEQAFNHAPVKGVHVGRDGQARPKRTPGHDEQQQAGRTGLTPGQARAEVTALWRRTRTGQAFAAALAESGWTLCRGDRRAFVLVDRMGEVHSLARRIEGARAKDVAARLADIDPATLPSVAEARASIRAAAPPSAELVRLPRVSRRSFAKAGEVTRRGRPQAADLSTGASAKADRRDGHAGGGGLYVTVSWKRLDYSRDLIPAAANGNGAPSWTSARIAGMGQFRAEARMATTPHEGRAEVMQRPVRPVPVQNEPVADSGDASAREVDGVLDSIAHEVACRTAMICDGIAADFAARIRAARMSGPRDQVVGIIRALKQARKEAVRYAREASAVELTARQKAARVRFRRGQLRSISGIIKL